MTSFISNFAHYETVINRIRAVRQTLWLGTADMKDLYIKMGRDTVPFLKLLSDLLRRGVEIRLLHAKEPGENFRNDFDRFPLLAEHLERALCPRVHFKIVVCDLETVYIGSANLTGAGIGMKGENHRNFEAGILTTDPALVEAAIEQFDSVWRGSHCKNCKRKAYCKDTIK
jgi:phosphatidylserine/phosphatidylglycerophosphate/cardiolipin synthase-like enzyme